MIDAHVTSTESLYMYTRYTVHIIYVFEFSRSGTELNLFVQFILAIKKNQPKQAKNRTLV